VFGARCRIARRIALCSIAAPGARDAKSRHRPRAEFKPELACPHLKHPRSRTRRLQCGTGGS
jgi:hypothetical protein